MSKVIVNIDIELVQRINNMQYVLDEFKETYNKPTIISRWKWRKITKKFNRLVNDILKAYANGEKRYYTKKATKMVSTYYFIDMDYGW